MAWDVTVPDTFPESQHLSSTAAEQGSGCQTGSRRDCSGY